MRMDRVSNRARVRVRVMYRISIPNPKLIGLWSVLGLVFSLSVLTLTLILTLTLTFVLGLGTVTLFLTLLTLLTYCQLHAVHCLC